MKRAQNRDSFRWIRVIMKGREEQKPVVFITYFCLVCAILLFFREIGDFSCNRLLVLGSILLLGSALWPFKKKSRWKAALFVLFAYFLCFCLLKKPLDEQLNILIYCLLNQKTGSGDFTLLFLALSFLVSLLCLFLVPVFNKGWIFYAFTLFLLLLSPLFGYRPSGGVLGLLAAFHIGNSVYYTVYQKWSDETEEKNTKDAVLQKSFIAGLLLVFGAFFLAKLVSDESRRDWMEESAQFTQSLTHGVKTPANPLASNRRSGESRTSVYSSGSVGVQSGKISRGNHYASSVLQLELTLSEMPEERMYLKDFTGGNYSGDAWEKADEADFYAGLNIGQGEWASAYLAPDYFEQRQFELIRYGKREMEQKEGGNQGGQSVTEPESQKMEIRPVNGAQNSFFSPYLSSYVSRDSRGVYRFDLFSWKEYYQYRERLGEKPLQWFAQMEEPYRTYAAEHYLLVPEERLPRLLSLCRKNPLKDPREITLWIRQALTDYAAYSQTPGFMPYGTDIAEYFLFDGQEGYCQHFATAAVLMYRMQGIPARYVTGYAADPADFSLGTDGLYHARLTDEKAHAWAEIYLGGPGWLPVEVTPPAGQTDDSGSEDKRAGAEDHEEGLENQQDWMLSFIQEEPEESKAEEENREDFYEEEGSGEEIGEESQKLPDEGSSQSEKQDTDGKEKESGNTPGKGEAGGLASMATAGILVIVSLAFTGAGRAAIRQRKKRLLQLGADELYQKMVAVLHLAGYGKEFDGTEQEFCRAIIAELEKEEESEDDLGILFYSENRLSFEELEEIRACAFQTAYGREVSSDKEREKVREGYEIMAADIAGRLYGIKKIKWRIMEILLVLER